MGIDPQLTYGLINNLKETNFKPKPLNYVNNTIILWQKTIVK